MSGVNAAAAVASCERADRKCHTFYFEAAKKTSLHGRKPDVQMLRLVQIRLVKKRIFELHQTSSKTGKIRQSHDFIVNKWQTNKPMQRLGALCVGACV